MISPRKPQISINGQNFYFHISFYKLSPAVALSTQAFLRFSIHKGRQIFQEGSELSWEATSEGLSFTKNHLNFAIFNYDGKRQEEFTLKLTIISSQAETVVDQCILDYGAYISALKSLNTKKFTSQCTMESGALLYLEVFVEQSRYALEKLVRESEAGKSRNDESSRSAIIKVADRKIDKSFSPKRGRQNPFKRISPKRQRKILGDQFVNSVEISINKEKVSSIKSGQPNISQILTTTKLQPKVQIVQEMKEQKIIIEKEEKINDSQQPQTQHFVFGQQFTQTIQLSQNNFQTNEEIEQQKDTQKVEVTNQSPHSIQTQELKQGLIPENKQIGEIKVLTKQKKDFFQDKSLKFKIMFIAIILISLILEACLQRRENLNALPQPFLNQTAQNASPSIKNPHKGSKIKSSKAKKEKSTRSI